MSKYHQASRWNYKSPALRKRMAPTNGQPCGICGFPIRKDQLWDIDHIRALKDGGDHSPSNLRVAHRSCNRRRSNKPKVTPPAPDKTTYSRLDGWDPQ